MIVITTMNELPDYCYECPCHDNEHGHCNADADKRYNLEYRPFWCPLKDFKKTGTSESLAKTAYKQLKEQEGKAVKWE